MLADDEVAFKVLHASSVIEEFFFPVTGGDLMIVTFSFLCGSLKDASEIRKIKLLRLKVILATE